jgi:hypothetical protein
MDETSIFSSDRRSLARLMGLDEDAESPWAERDFGAILAHQLAAPLEPDLQSVDPGVGGRLKELAAGGAAPPATFRDLLHHGQPPVELLELTQKFAKRCRKGPDSPMPDEVSTILYLLSITVARIKCHARISRLDDESLRASLQWALAQSWLVGEMRQLLLDGAAALGQTDEAAS